MIYQSKPLAPPPSGFPSMPQRPGIPGGPPGGGSGPPVNMFSRKAGGLGLFKPHRHKGTSVSDGFASHQVPEADTLMS